MIKKIYLIPALVVLSCIYYKLRRTSSPQVIIPDINFDEIPIPKEDDPIPQEIPTSIEPIPQEIPTSIEPIPQEIITCVEPLRVSKDLLKLIGRGDGEILYNICEIITLLDFYLEKENLITNQVVTLNNALATIMSEEVNSIIEYTLFVNKLFAYHTSRY